MNFDWSFYDPSRDKIMDQWAQASYIPPLKWSPNITRIKEIKIIEIIIYSIIVLIKDLILL